MSVPFAALLPVFLLIVAGVVVRRVLLPEDGHWLGIERLVYYVMIPALLIETLSRADFGAVPVGGVGAALVAAVLLVSLICLAIRPLLAGRWQLDGPGFTSVFQGSTRWQTFVALAVAASLYGDRGLAIASVAIVAMIPLLNVVNVWVLAHFAAPQRPDWRRIAWAIAQNPFIWSCALGLLLNVLAVPIPRPLHAFADALGRSSLALGLLLVGAGLRIQGVIRPRAITLIAVGLKLVVMPAVAIGLGIAMQLDGANLVIVACCASVPAPSSAYVLARQMGGDVPLMAQILTLQTILAAVTMPIALALAS